MTNDERTMNINPLAEFTPYKEIRARAREIAQFQSAAALLSWDQMTYMPPKALDFRGEQLAYFNGRAHSLFTDPQVGRWLGECEDAGFLDAGDSELSANVRQWRRHYTRATCLPTALVEEYEKVKIHGNAAWMEARARSEFALFAPHLQKNLELTRQMAELWGYAQCPYDALLEGYEPGARAAELQALFATLRPAIVELLGPAAEASARLPADLLAGEYPVAQQQAFNREVAAAIGFDFEAGGIATTTHPFCSGVAPGDCRLTTRYDAGNFFVSLYGVLHEAGHGMYEQGLPAGAFGTPAGTAVSLGIHESQSRLWENQVGRSRGFWETWLPRAVHYFPHLAARTPAEMFAAANRVRPSFIRVEADQVTYDLHIMLRFELERRLIAGSLAVADVPGAWNEDFAALFGVAVPDDTHGCLQDVHWSEGLLGYFPTYTLGNLNAAQLFRRALADSPDLAADLAAGRYGGLLGWLRAKIHHQGERLLPGELMTAATGEPTRADYYLAALREKFGA
jgi:carboxypeptidase Taq